MVLPGIAVADDQVAAGRSLQLEQSGKVGRVALAVAVDEADERAGGSAKAVDHGPGVAFPHRLAQQEDREGLRQLPDDLDCVVGRAILADDKPQRQMLALGDHLIKLGESFTDASGLVVRG